jgi:glutamate-1-semialdehyde 2,1-aminomutase
MARNADEAQATIDEPLRHLVRIYLANRGIWEAIVGAGPTCSVPADADDVDAYVGAFGELVDELTS